MVVSLDFIYPINVMNRELIICMDDIIKSWNPKPAWYRFRNTWESIEVPEEYEKPPKEEFEAKLQELLDAQPLKELREARDKILSTTDKYATIDYPHATDEEKQAWLDYRQALRDLPANTTDPENPVWPQAPTP
jgi:hypothetical protein